MSSWRALILYTGICSLFFASFIPMRLAADEPKLGSAGSTVSANASKPALTKSTSVSIGKRTIDGITEVKLLPSGKVKLSFSGGSGAWPIEAFPTGFLEGWGQSEAIEAKRTLDAGREEQLRQQQEEAQQQIRAAESQLRQIPKICSSKDALESLRFISWRNDNEGAAYDRDFRGEMELEFRDTDAVPVELIRLRSRNTLLGTEVTLASVASGVIRIKVKAMVVGRNEQLNTERMKEFFEVLRTLGGLLGIDEQQLVDWTAARLRQSANRELWRFKSSDKTKEILIVFVGGTTLRGDRMEVAVNFMTQQWVDLKEKLEAAPLQP
jgi:hypothetical protein